LEEQLIAKPYPVFVQAGGFFLTEEKKQKYASHKEED
jgi:hypothetical protein